MVLILTEGIWLNVILTSNKLCKVNWLMPTLLFVVAMGWNLEHTSITPIMIETLPILAAISQLLTSNGTVLEVDHNFNAAFFIGIAIMCYLPVAVFIVPFFFVFVTYKSYHWRDFIVAILGITAPAIILFTYAFLTDKLDYYFILIRHDILNVGLYISSQGVADIVKNIIFILILLWALLSQISTLNDSTIQQRINTVLFILPLLGAILMLPYDKLFTIDTQPTALVFAFIGSNLLAADRKHAWMNEVLFWIIIITPIVVN